MTRILAALGLLFSGQALADDNAVAWRLYEQGRFAEAAEIFTDPAWKGAALYKSDQHWRAAEAFVRGDDADSLYNLGNSYALLGYYELALQAYLGALHRQPGMADALANADIMRTLLSRADDSGQEGLTPPAKKVDDIEAEEQEKQDGGNSGGNEQGKAEDQRRGADKGGEQQQSDEAGSTQSDQGGAGNGTERNDRPGASGTDVAGRVGQGESAEEISGGSEGEGAADANAVGQRTRLESEQATEQWLNRIRDDPAKFLKARIALEARRRAAAGNLPPAGGDTW